MMCISAILEREKLANEQAEYLGEQLVKFVTIGGVANFKDSLKDVLNLSYDLDDQLLLVFLRKMEHGEHWMKLLGPLRFIFHEEYNADFSPKYISV